MNSLWFFEDVNLFKVLCPHKFKAFKNDHDFDAYKKKDYIYFEEDAANKIYLIEKGKVKIGYYIDNKTSICPIGVQTMHELMRDNQTFSFKIYKFIGLKFKKLERRLQLLLFKDAKTRLLEFLDELCTEYGYDCEKTGDHIIKHPYTQKDIASLLGTSRPTLNILLKELKDENYIDFTRKEIRILKKAV